MSDECIVPLFFVQYTRDTGACFPNTQAFLLHSTPFIRQLMSLHYLIYVLYSSWGSVVAYNKRIGWVNGSSRPLKMIPISRCKLPSCLLFEIRCCCYRKDSTKKRIHGHHCRTVALLVDSAQGKFIFYVVVMHHVVYHCCDNVDTENGCVLY